MRFTQGLFYRQTFQSGLLTLEEVERCLVMTDDRNLNISHTYIGAEIALSEIAGLCPGDACVIEKSAGLILDGRHE